MIWSFLNFEFLIGPELGVSRKKGQLSVDFVLDTFFGHALVKRFVVVVENLEVVFTTANVTGEGGN